MTDITDKNKSDTPVTLIKKGEKLTIPHINPQNLAQIMENRENIMYVTDSSGRIRLCSSSFTAKTSLSEGDGTDLLYGSILACEARRRVFDGYQEIVETDFIVRDSVVSMLLTLLPFEYDDEVQLLAIGKDLTEKRKLERLNREYERLWDLASLAGKLAHELNNPLSYMVYNMDVLGNEVPDLIDALKAVGGSDNPQVDQNIKLALSDSLLGLSQIKETAQSLSMYSHFGKEASLAANVNYIVDLALTMASSDLKYRMNVDKNYTSQKVVYASEGHLYHIFLNLILFAAGQIPEGKASVNLLSVVTEDIKENIFIKFAFPFQSQTPITEEMLFNPLSVFNASQRMNTPALSAFLLSKAGGKLKFHVSDNTGVFTVILPEYGDQKVRMMTNEFCSSGGSKMRILVVDDNPAIRNLFGKMLENCIISTCDSGESALDLISTGNNFDLVVCDILMPSMNGKEFHEMVCQKYPELKNRFIMVSGGLFSPEIHEYIYKLGIPLVEKPLEVGKLKKVILETVNSPVQL